MKSVSFVSLLILAACGGAQSTGTGTSGSGSGSGGNKPTAAGDAVFDVPVIEIRGLVFEPEALGRPGMPLVDAKKKTTIEKQRQVFASAKDPVQKEAHAAILATLLYQKSKDDKANEKDLLTEARKALRDAASLSGDKVDEITLRLLGSYELLLEDFAAAEKAWAMLVNKDPKNKEVQYNKAWWAFSLLKQFKNSEALAVVKDETLSEKQPELAYAAAWAKWRTGDDAGAWTALVTASKGWGSNPGREAIDRDLYLFAGRAKNVALSEVTGPLFTVMGAKDKRQQFQVLAKLGLESYQFAGRWQDAVNAIDKAFEVGGDTVMPNEKPVLRYQQAQFSIPLDQPELSAKIAKQMMEALPACGAKCSEEDKQQLIKNTYGMGRLFHVLYATANDVRYYQPAHDIYTETVGKIMDNQLRADAQKDIAVLETTLKNTKAGTGTHDKAAIGALLQRHNQEVQACYETALSSNPKLAGTLVLNIESDETGVIKGASTEPKAGVADMSAVAGCVAEAAKTWKLPKRGSRGATRIKLSYNLARADKK
ncbi:MAG: AgmX/PglI C-terminal domain-containing protein [Kofleriaceae bacterium]